MRGQEVLHALLGGLLLPALGGGLVDVHLAREHRQGAVVEVGLQGVDRSLPEQVGVVVVERAGEQLDVQRPLGRVVGLLEVLVQQAQSVHQGVGLVHAHLVVVEGDVEVDVLVVGEQAVVGDHGDPGGLGRIELGGERGAVDRGDQQHAHAGVDHLVDLLLLGGDVVVGVLHVDGEALALQALLDVVAVGDPALVGLGRHRDADGLVLGRGVGIGAAGAGALAAAGGQAERGHGGGAAQDEASAVVHGSLLVEVTTRSPRRGGTPRAADRALRASAPCRGRPFVGVDSGAGDGPLSEMPDASVASITRMITFTSRRMSTAATPLRVTTSQRRRTRGPRPLRGTLHAGDQRRSAPGDVTPHRPSARRKP